MGICKYCGKKAGFFKKEHSECASNFRTGTYLITDIASKSIIEDSDFDKLNVEIRNIAEKRFISDQDIVRKYLVKGFDRAVNTFLEDGILSEEEEEKLSKFIDHYNFEQELMNKNGSMEKIVKASILRDVMNGKEPTSKLQITTPLPIMLQKSEYVIWLFNSVLFYEQRVRTVYQGRSQGMSIKIAKGLYYRTGAFKGNPVKTEEMMLIATGSVILTNINLYFVASNKNIKIPFNKLLTLEPYEDGIGIQKDGSSAKPQIYKGLDGWFVYNFIMNMNSQ